MICHRVIRKSDNYLVTKGDANYRKDNVPVYVEDLLGKICAIQRERNLRPVRGGWAGRIKSLFLPLWCKALKIARYLVTHLVL